MRKRNHLPQFTKSHWSDPTTYRSSRPHGVARFANPTPSAIAKASARRWLYLNSGPEKDAARQAHGVI